MSSQKSRIAALQALPVYMDRQAAVEKACTLISQAAEEGILSADVDADIILGTRWNLDVAGHYARPDVFQLFVRKTPTPIVTFLSPEEDADVKVDDGRRNMEPDEV